LIHEFVQYCENELKNTASSVDDFEKGLITEGIIPGRVKVYGMKNSAYIGVMTKEEFDKRNREELLKNKAKQQRQEQQQQDLSQTKIG
jgi:hypothetical protein